MNRLKLLAAVAVAVLLLVIVAQNTQGTTVRLLMLKVSMPLAMLLGVLLLGGFVCGLLAAMVWGARPRTGSDVRS